MDIVRLKRYRKHAVLEHARAVFQLSQKTLREELAKLEVRNVPLSEKSKLLSLDYDFWVQHVPDSATALQKWLEYTKVTKIINTYLNLYSRCTRIYPRWNVLGARSGRMSASSPSVQNIPKTRYGIRALFVPDDSRHIFIRADYVAQEMFTLCEAMLGMGIDGPLHRILKSGDDIHTLAASIVLEKPKEKVTKDERQGQKVLNFGVPGGLGARSLAEYAFKNYGVRWDIPTARQRRDAFFRAFPDIRMYLEALQRPEVELLREIVDEPTFYDILEEVDRSQYRYIREYLRNSPAIEYQAIAERLERSVPAVLPTGRVRRGCTFTETANTYFQGLASDVTKEACFNAWVARLDLRLVVHDELLIQARRSEYEGAALALRQAMEMAFRAVCPNLGPYARVEVSGPLERWGTLTDETGKEYTI